MKIKRQLIFEVEGNCVVKKNQYKYTRKGGKSWGYKPKNVVDFIDSALWQIKGELGKYKKIELPICNDVSVHLMFDIEHRDKDGDGMQTTIWDILVKAGVIKDDKLVTQWGGIKSRKQPKDLVQIFVKEL